MGLGIWVYFAWFFYFALFLVCILKVFSLLFLVFVSFLPVYGSSFFSRELRCFLSEFLSRWGNVTDLNFGILALFGPVGSWLWDLQGDVLHSRHYSRVFTWHFLRFSCFFYDVFYGVQWGLSSVFCCALGV